MRNHGRCPGEAAVFLGMVLLDAPLNAANQILAAGLDLPGGSQIWIGATVALLALVCFGWRITRSGGKKQPTDEAAAAPDRIAQLLAEKEKAEEANRLKSEFLANISQEIRTPLGSILGTLELALLTDPTAEQREYLEVSKNSAQALLDLLEDIVDFSKAEAEDIEIGHSEFSLRACLRSALSTMSLRAADKKLELDTQIADEIPDRLIGDPDRLRLVLLKILDNAVKVSSNGKILFHVGLEASDTGLKRNSTGSICLVFSIEDNGPGIPGDKRETIFQSARPADGPMTRKYGGTGMGLAVCGRFVRLMGGRIWVDRSDKSGSRFCFTARFDLPKGTALVQTPSEPNGKTEWTNAVRVLVAEDNRVNQMVTSRLLEKHGFQTFLANNGREALQILQWQPVDMVLMDVQMPVMDGLEATRRIREIEKKTGKHLPILAMTAKALQGDRDQCLSAGMDGYIAKPVESKQLLQAIRNVVAQ